MGKRWDEQDDDGMEGREKGREKEKERPKGGKKHRE